MKHIRFNTGGQVWRSIMIPMGTQVWDEVFRNLPQPIYNLVDHGVYYIVRGR